MSFIEINKEVLFSPDLRHKMNIYIDKKKKEGYRVDVTVTTRGVKVSSKLAIALDE